MKPHWDNRFTVRTATAVYGYERCGVCGGVSVDFYSEESERPHEMYRLLHPWQSSKSYSHGLSRIELNVFGHFTRGAVLL